jgi:hypothetical protein
MNSINCKSQKGFSLIDAMISAVVLAVGLLALAALQANVSRNAADARARSQIAAFVEEVVERQRAFGVSSDFAAVPEDALWTDAEEAAVGINAGVTGFNLELSSVHYDGRSGGFVTPVLAGLKPSDPQYKLLHSVATWTDASGQARRFYLASILSPRTLSSSSLSYGTPTSGGDSGLALPRIRRLTSSVEVPGMIPIATGADSKTAATNPKPNVGQTKTSFDVLTYQSNVKCVASGTTACVEIQQKVETAIVQCQCTTGVTLTEARVLYPQWPAYWNGYRYKLYTPKIAADPPGKNKATGPSPNKANQDPLCTECCRDHHDGTSGPTHVKFDPFRTSAHDHYKIVSGKLVLAEDGDDYLEACRMIRVDGFWRTAQDMKLDHFGLLRTATLNTRDHGLPSPDSATTLPDDIDATAAYQDFAKTLLKSNYVPEQTPISADTLYKAEVIDKVMLDLLAINRPEPIDERYLHARGLYVDHIEPEVETAIQNAYDNCPDDVTNKEECVLPLLAFTSINLTEVAYYAAGLETVPGGKVPADYLQVLTSGFVEFNPSAPKRGRVTAVSNAPEDTSGPYIRSYITKSNSGLAVSARGIDPEDDDDPTLDSDNANAYAGTQKFDITGNITSGSGKFSVTVNLPNDYDGLLNDLNTSRAPAVSWKIGGLDDNCAGAPISSQGDIDYVCTTTTTLPKDVAITASAYNIVQTRKLTGNSTVNINCTQGSKLGEFTSPKQVDIKYCRNYKVSAIAVNPATTVFSPAAAAIVPMNSGFIGNLNTGVGSESSTIVFNQLPSQNALITLDFLLEAETIAPAACTFNASGNLSTFVQECP